MIPHAWCWGNIPAPVAKRGFALKSLLRPMRRLNLQQGKIGYILLWLLGVPIPVLIVISLLRGCS